MLKVADGKQTARSAAADVENRAALAVPDVSETAVSGCCVQSERKRNAA